MEVQPTPACRAMTLVEVLIVSTLVVFVIGGFLSAVRMCSQSVGFHSAVTQQVRRSEGMIDQMLVGLRWISVKDSDPSKVSTSFPAGVPGDKAPQVSFRRLKGIDANGNYLWGDRITYYWLPSAAENEKYADGDIAAYDSNDIDGVDHDMNGVRNDGVIWRLIEDEDGDGKLDDLGVESFTGTSYRSVVFTNVPPPFYRNGGAVQLLDSFKVDVSFVNHSITLTVKRFVETGETVAPDMAPRPEGVALTGSVLTSNTVTVLTTQRTFCARN